MSTAASSTSLENLQKAYDAFYNAMSHIPYRQDVEAACVKTWEKNATETCVRQFAEYHFSFIPTSRPDAFVARGFKSRVVQPSTVTIHCNELNIKLGEGSSTTHGFSHAVNNAVTKALDNIKAIKANPHFVPVSPTVYPPSSNLYKV